MMNRIQRVILTAATLIGGLTPAWQACAQLSFTPLGTLPGQGLRLSLAYGISGDGFTVVGRSGVESPTGFDAAFRWTSATGMQAVTSTAPSSYGSAYAASFDGSVIVGSSAGGPFRWTQGTGPVPLVPLPGGNGGGDAYGVSASGGTIVGRGNVGQSFRAARWSQGAGQLLGDLPGWLYSRAEDVSAAGDVIVGTGTDPQLRSYPFRWTSGSGMVALPLLAGYTQGSAGDVSEDGLIAAGFCVENSVLRAVRWVGGTVQDLGLLPGETSSHALAITADGATVLGLSGQRMFLWTEAHGMSDLSAILAPVIPAGWFISAATGISADGTVITGFGNNPATNTGEAWVATIPAPGALVALLSLQIWLAARRNRRWGSSMPGIPERLR